MRVLCALIKRHTRLCFKDKGMFFTSLITPVILLVLYATFLGNVYRDSFLSALPPGLNLAEELINGCVGGQLVSSILAVSCVTVAFCSNLLMVQDRVNESRRDLTIAPVKSSTLAMGYYVSTLLSTLLICLAAAGIGLAYVAGMGWYMTAEDVLYLLLDVFLLVLFGTALSSLINFFLRTQGQISAVGTIVSSGYGFICGAYMPISQFSDGLQKVLLFLPGTYVTSLIRNHALRGVFAEMERQKFPAEIIKGIQDSIDCNLTFFGQPVETGTMYLILASTILVLIAAYVLLNVWLGKRAE